MSKADEMFEKLGYEKIDKEKLKHIRFTSDIDKTTKANICFHKVFHKIEIYFWDAQERCEMVKPLSIQELQAINEKVKELGWNE